MRKISVQLTDCWYLTLVMDSSCNLQPILHRHSWSEVARWSRTRVAKFGHSADFRVLQDKLYGKSLLKNRDPKFSTNCMGNHYSDIRLNHYCENYCKYRRSMEVPVSWCMPLGFTYNSFQVLKYSYKCFGTRYLGRQLYLT